MASAGRDHSAVVTTKGEVFVFGDNSDGQLGIGSIGGVNANPVLLKKLQDPANGFLDQEVLVDDDVLEHSVRQVSCGAEHTGFVTDSGQLFLCGSGQFGKLGLGDEQDRPSPTLVLETHFSKQRIMMVACGDQHTLVLTMQNNIYTFGHINNHHISTPKHVKNEKLDNETPVMIATAGALNLVLTMQGHIFSWGENRYGQAGFAPVRIWVNEPMKINANFDSKHVVFIAASHNHAAAVTECGCLYTWGQNKYGQLGLGTGDAQPHPTPTLVNVDSFEGQKVVMVSCGYAHTLVVTNDGSLWVCGNGDNGRLGIASQQLLQNQRSFAKIHPSSFQNSHVLTASAGYNHSLVVTTNGAVWTFGSNQDAVLRDLTGKIGHGPSCFSQRTPRLLMIQDARGHILAGRFVPAPLDQDKTVALCTGLHKRLGSESSIACMGMDLTRTVVTQYSFTDAPSEEGLSEGLLRLIGARFPVSTSNSTQPCQLCVQQSNTGLNLSGVPYEIMNMTTEILQQDEQIDLVSLQTLQKDVSRTEFLLRMMPNHIFGNTDTYRQVENILQNQKEKYEAAKHRLNTDYDREKLQALITVLVPPLYKSRIY